MILAIALFTGITLRTCKWEPLPIPGPGASQESQIKPMSPKVIFDSFNDSVVKIVTDTGSGSGFFVKNGRLIATCFHVISGAKQISVEGTHGKKWSVESVSFNKEQDAALLKLSEDTLRKPIPIGDVNKLQPGDELDVIGSPLGFLTGSLTTGILSAKRATDATEVLQITAAVSHH